MRNAIKATEARTWILLLAFFMWAPVHAQEEGESPRIVVSGEGSAEVAPDIAVLRLTVTREANSARDALDANTEAMSEVFAALRETGVEERDLQTSNFSIQPRYQTIKAQIAGERPQPRIIGYVVRNSLTVRVRDIDRVGEIIDRSVSLGVNDGGNIRFSNADTTEVLEKARMNAVADARFKAVTLASAAGVKLGRVLEISEQSTGPGPLPVARAEMAMSRAADVPVAIGENSYRVNVRMVFAID